MRSESPRAGHREDVLDDLDVLLHRAAEGDRAAFADFYDATSATAYRLALTVAGDPATAEQAVLRAYTAAWHHSPTRGHGVSARCWLLGLVHGTARDGGSPGWLRTSDDVGAATRPPRRPGRRIRGLAGRG